MTQAGSEGMLHFNECGCFTFGDTDALHLAACDAPGHREKLERAAAHAVAKLGVTNIQWDPPLEPHVIAILKSAVRNTKATA